MEIWQYFLITIIAGLGIFCGKFLGRAAKEELKQGKKYFIYFKEVCIILFLSILFIIIFINYQAAAFIYLLALVLIIFFLYFANKDLLVNEINHNYINYVIFAFILFASIGNQKLFFITAALIFIYGFPTGSLLFHEKAKTKEYLIPFVLFVALASLLFLVFF